MKEISVYEVESSFYDYYSKCGYDIIPEVPTYPSPDESVLFIGAQISTWKPKVLSETPIGSIANPQTCIRTQNLDYYSDSSRAMNFCTVFRTHGVLTDKSLNEAITESYEYLNNVLNIPDEEILVKTSTELLGRFACQATTEIDTEIADYYVWEYGHPRLSGEGITYALKNPDGAFHDIGNVIEIRRDGETVAVEWGFGEEVISQAMMGGYHPLVHSRYLPDSVKDGLDTPIETRIADAALAIVVMSGLGVEPSNRHAGDVLSKYMHRFGELAAISGMKSAERILDNVAEYNHPNSSTVSDIISESYRLAGKSIYKNTTARYN